MWKKKTNLKIEDWIKTIQNKGCGEILLTSIDFEGTEMGFDIELINKIYDLMEKPLIISGGCGCLNDISKVKEKFSKVSIALASVLHYDTLSISDIKKI